MGGYVTETRRSPGFALGQNMTFYWPKRASYPALEAEEFSPNNVYFGVPTQTTTSFRTRGSEFNDLGAKDSSSWAVANSAIMKNDQAKRASKFDTGHTFHTEKRDVRISEHTLLDQYGRVRFRGKLGPPIGVYSSLGNGNRWDFPDATGSSQASLEAWGTRAISDTLPLNSPADLATMLIELRREGLPALAGLSLLRKRHVPTAKSGGQWNPAGMAGEHLNIEFGWKPLINDVKAAARAAAMSSEILKQFQEESGALLHRQRNFPKTTESSFGTVGTFGQWSVCNSGPDTSNWLALESVQTTQAVVQTQKVWFRGAFTYYLQSENLTLNKLHEIAEKAKHVFGMEITPSVVWNVAPWTWLIDWVGNIGDNITNATALSKDGMVLRYGYVMRETHLTRTRSSPVSTMYGGRRLDLSSTYALTRKERIRATPFGFGLNPDTFSGRQWAILAALGMTRGDRALRLSD